MAYERTNVAYRRLQKAYHAWADKSGIALADRDNETFLRFRRELPGNKLDGLGVPEKLSDYGWFRKNQDFFTPFSGYAPAKKNDKPVINENDAGHNPTAAVDLQDLPNRVIALLTPLISEITALREKVLLADVLSAENERLREEADLLRQKCSKLEEELELLTAPSNPPSVSSKPTLIRKGSVSDVFEVSSRNGPIVNSDCVSLYDLPNIQAKKAAIHEARREGLYVSVGNTIYYSLKEVMVFIEKNGLKTEAAFWESIDQIKQPRIKPFYPKNTDDLRKIADANNQKRISVRLTSTTQPVLNRAGFL
jgi:hypothetical protein